MGIRLGGFAQLFLQADKQTTPKTLVKKTPTKQNSMSQIKKKRSLKPCYIMSCNLGEAELHRRIPEDGGVNSAVCIEPLRAMKARQKVYDFNPDLNLAQKNPVIRKRRDDFLLFLSPCIRKQGHCGAHAFLMYEHHSFHNPSFPFLSLYSTSYRRNGSVRHC